MHIDRFGHAAIKVRDLETTETFYTDVLGFHVAERYPEDQEVIFGFGAEGHLLVQAVGKDAPAPDAKTLGVHHLAFVIDGGEHGLHSVRAELGARDIAYRDVDHGDHRSVYFRDPDGHMLEVYHAPVTENDVPAGERLGRARDFLLGNARLVERAAFDVCSCNADADRLVDALAAYRNADGGFGHALEPDLRVPLSQPLHTEFALQTLMDAGVRRPAIAPRCSE